MATVEERYFAGELNLLDAYFLYRNSQYDKIPGGAEYWRVKASMGTSSEISNLAEVWEKTLTNPFNVPDSASISVSPSENTVLINLTPHGDGGSPITSYHIVLRNQTTNQEIVQTLHGTTSILIQNLDSGTNYTVYAIVTNAVGNSPENSVSFKTDDSTIPIPIPTPTPMPPSPPTITLSAETLSIINKFDTGIYKVMGNYPLNTIIELVKSGGMTNEDFTKTVKANLEYGQFVDTSVTPEPIPEPTPVEKTWCIDVYQINEFGGVYSIHKEDVKRLELLEWEATTMVKECGDPIPTDQEVKDFYNYADTSIDTNMISQSIGAFKLQNGRVTGDIIYIAETAFNPYYYNKSITSIVQIKDQMGNVIKLKPNNLNFTETERDERISINENVGDLNAVKIEFYVWKGINDPKAFSIVKFDEIVAEEIGLDPCPIGQHRDFNNKCVDNDQPIGGTTSILGKVMGVTALLGTLALLASKRR